MSVHPGTVDTEVQKAWTESYGNVLGKILEKGSQLIGKTAPEGAEAGLWAATSTDIFEGNWKDFQVSQSTTVLLSTHLHAWSGKLLLRGVWQTAHGDGSS